MPSITRYNAQAQELSRFKKSVNRAGTTVRSMSMTLTGTEPHYLQLMQKTGQIERTVDSEFQDEAAKFKQYVVRHRFYVAGS